MDISALGAKVCRALLCSLLFNFLTRIRKEVAFPKGVANKRRTLRGYSRILLLE
jgi:hypothetical protein